MKAHTKIHRAKELCSSTVPTETFYFLIERIPAAVLACLPPQQLAQLVMALTVPQVSTLEVLGDRGLPVAFPPRPFLGRGPGALARWPHRLLRARPGHEAEAPSKSA